MSRVERAFVMVVDRGAATFPWLASTKLRSCKAASSEHRRRWRQFAHAGHYPGTVCFAPEAERELEDDELVGMCAHELGHIVGDALKFPAHAKPWRGAKTPEAVQQEANEISARFFGIPIRYNAREIQVPVR